MLDRLSSSERRGIALAFAAACLAFRAWAFPNMSRVVTIPGVIATGVLALAFSLARNPKICSLLASHLGDGNGKVKGAEKIRAVTAILMLLIIMGASYWELPFHLCQRHYV